MDATNEQQRAIDPLIKLVAKQLEAEEGTPPHGEYVVNLTARVRFDASNPANRTYWVECEIDADKV
jgi:hypothetical protein